MAAFVSKFTGGTLVRKPTATKALAPKPAVPAPYRPPAPAVLPPDPVYEQSVAGLGKQRDLNYAGLEQQRQAGLLQYGYTADATGGIQFDPTNPYSQAAILKRNYDQARTGNTNSYAAQGQLWAGSLQNAQDQANQAEAQSSDALQKQLLAFLARNTMDRAQTGLDYESGIGQAGAARIEAAPSSPLYQPITSAPAPALPRPATAPAYQSVKGKDSSNRPGVWHIYKDGRRVFVRS